MPDPEGIAGTLVALGKRREPAPLADARHAVPAARQDLVGVGLMAHVVDNTRRPGEPTTGGSGQQGSSGAASPRKFAADASFR